ncbi:hypothetical protein HMN09_00789600 [Mycena chlorophos]|uniref:Uncharacterized protein n=1 Tax=Mycena chlorophos TaxID=658473 RepID=A0A8H6SU19_MYCCL|nr:hypothetical protein HMN09_00789600 [Mycena chlorophos]
MRSALEVFPEEVLLLVFRHAVSPSWTMAYNGDVPWTRSMHGDAAVDTKLAIIHVDKTWHRVGLELLYRSIILYHVDQLPVLVQRLEERPDLAMHVRRVGLCYYLTPGWTKLHLEESANLLGLCPGVRSFSLGGVSEISPDFAFPIPVVPRHLLGSITELEVNSKHIEYKAIYPLLLDLAPTLHTLSIALPIEYTLAKDTSFGHRGAGRLWSRGHWVPASA